MNIPSESEELQKALTELATAMTRVICTRVDQAVAEIMVGKLPAGAMNKHHNGSRTSMAMVTEAKTPAHEEAFINKLEVSKRLGKTLRTVDNWMNRGILPYYKIGRSVEFRWSEVEQHLAQTARVSRRY
jgi:excisionase family DNA binding protein